MINYMKKFAVVFLSLILITSTIVNSAQFVFAENIKVIESSKTATEKKSVKPLRQSPPEHPDHPKDQDHPEHPVPPERPDPIEPTANVNANLISEGSLDVVEKYNRLYEKATKGNVRVLVELNIDFKPEGEFEFENEIKEQRKKNSKCTR